MWKAVGFAPLLLLLVVTSSMADPVPRKDAREAGARYAQTHGAANTCGGLRVSKNAEALKTQYSGADLEAFNAQAANVLASWQKVKNCTLPNDPNPCRIMIQLRCQSAVSEIGPGGSAIPDLLEIGSP